MSINVNQSGDFELRVPALSREDVYNMQLAIATAIEMLADSDSDNSMEIKAFALLQRHLLWQPKQIKRRTEQSTPKPTAS